MKQATFIIATSHESRRPILALKSVSEKQNSSLEKQINLFYQGLVYQLNKEDEFDKTLYQDEVLNDESNDEFDNEEENARSNDEEGYEFDYHRHK